MKHFLAFVIFLVILDKSSAQETMIFNNEPEEIRTFLSKPYKKIEIKTISRRSQSTDTMVSNIKIIHFYGDTICIIYSHSKDQENDTTVYKYDNCKKPISKKGKNINNDYKNYYQKCSLKSREGNELEISFGSLNAVAFYTKYYYFSNGNLGSELIYDLYDTTILLRSTEYTYLHNKLDSINEFYFVDEQKLRNRTTRYFYKNQLDSVHYYNFNFDLIDKMIYQYNEFGRPVYITTKQPNACRYIYKNADPEKIIPDRGNLEYHITYFD